MSIECSVVVPLCNGESTLPTLHLRLIATLRRLAIPYEIIYVDDGSTDQTPELIRELHLQEAAVKAVLLSRSFGVEAALSAGMEAATGRVVITIAADLLDPPELIPDMLDRWSEGYQIVYARPRQRRAGFFKQAACFLLDGMLRRAAKVSIPVDTGEYVLMDRSVVEQLNSLPERTRLIQGLRSWIGFRQADVLYDRDRRGDRELRHSLGRLARLGVDGIFAFSETPLKLVTVAGLTLLALGVFAGAAKAMGSLAIGWTVLAVTGLAGVQMLGLGIVGEYIARIHHEVRGRPLYIARERLGFRPSPRPVRNVLEFLPTRDIERPEQLTAGRLSGNWSDSLLGGDSRSTS